MHQPTRIPSQYNQTHQIQQQIRLSPHAIRPQVPVNCPPQRPKKYSRTSSRHGHRHGELRAPPNCSNLDAGLSDFSQGLRYILRLLRIRIRMHSDRRKLIDQIQELKQIKSHTISHPLIPSHTIAYRLNARN
ncbi:hypothetical protein M758_12G012100 [Ceratodon purpureus]|uniref:Uncharacterized protein n=1 Tax=Ceratodon purpureus TaxID=3225 RepID=A0A8T0G853_CERPU|nr:hypothetical protein KC19_12G011500 [Ceratodon purpureus]KAG0597660.1 hypothetical protein M758_12G012100 [Ceratodon purpureus]